MVNENRILKWIGIIIGGLIIVGILMMFISMFSFGGYGMMGGRHGCW